MLKLGERIKKYRQQNGKTQEALANELGVTPQAVSRWEKGICYPDLEMIPLIANCFNVSIDDLFGYENERERRLNTLTERINEMILENNGKDVSMDACISLAREALIEFPGNEKLMFALASALYTAGYVRYGEHHLDDEDAYRVYDIARHRKYAEWQEAMKLFEKLLQSLQDGSIRQEAVVQLSQLYKNTGEHEKAMQLSESAPDLTASKSFLRINAFDGQEAVAATGEALIDLILRGTELIENIVRTDRIMTSQTAADMLLNAIRMFELVCVNHDYGKFNAWLACLYMLRSYYLWLAKDHNASFEALELALDHARRYDNLHVDCQEFYSSPLLRHVKMNIDTLPESLNFSRELPDVWPWWCVPERDRVKTEMQADPRWNDWVQRTKE